MIDFDIKKYLVENKLTRNSRLLGEAEAELTDPESILPYYPGLPTKVLAKETGFNLEHIATVLEEYYNSLKYKYQYATFRVMYDIGDYLEYKFNPEGSYEEYSDYRRETDTVPVLTFKTGAEQVKKSLQTNCHIFSGVQSHTKGWIFTNHGEFFPLLDSEGIKEYHKAKKSYEKQVSSFYDSLKYKGD